MRKIISLVTIFSLGVSFVLAKSAADKVTKIPAKRAFKMEPMNGYQSSSQSFDRERIVINNRNGWSAVEVDESKNGYGMIVAPTKPLYLNPDAGLFYVYRQWAGDDGTSGQIGSSLCVDCVDGTIEGNTWDVTYNINGAYEIGRYPSALGNEDYPYAIWNEYTGTGAPSYGGRPFYAYDEFGWDGGSFTAPIDTDLTWNDGKDLWVGSPTHDVTADGMDVFNISYSDWTRSNCYVFHSEAYDDGYIVFQNEVMFINEDAHLVGGDDEGSYTSTPVLANMVPVGDEGIGYGAVTGYFEGADVEASVVPGANTHTVIFKQTTDYGQTWSPNGLAAADAYYYIPDNVFDHMMSSGAFPTSWEDPDNCPDSEVITWSKLFLAYDFDIKTDTDGNPHIVVGILPTDGEYVYPGLLPENGFWHFTIDKDYLDVDVQGDPQTPTGWNYSFVVTMGDSWGWSDAAGGSLWQLTFPSLTISSEDDDVMYVTTSKVTEGEFVDPDEDPCTVDQIYDFWTLDNYVVKTTDGGATWWCPWNTDATTWVDADEDGEEDCVGAPGNAEDTDECYHLETFAHGANEADDDGLYLCYQKPDFMYGTTTGDLGWADNKQQVYVAYAELTSPPDCSEDSGCGAANGDANGDSTVNILDIVGMVNYILGAGSIAYECAADFNGDTTINILDIVAMVNCILGAGDCGDGRVVEANSNDASFASILKEGDSVMLSADGYVGAIQLTLRHDVEDFAIELTDAALIAEYNTVGKKTELIVVMPDNSDQELFVAEGDFEITKALVANSANFVEVSIVDQYAIMSSYPNPFNPQTTISYELYSDSNVELAVFNLMGQKVATLTNDFVEAGSYSSIWNGQDALGREVSSGVYVLKLTTDNEVISNKITLLR